MWVRETRGQATPSWNQSFSHLQRQLQQTQYQQSLLQPSLLLLLGLLLRLWREQSAVPWQEMSAALRMVPVVVVVAVVVVAAEAAVLV
jgi:hypothetical protein